MDRTESSSFQPPFCAFACPTREGRRSANLSNLSRAIPTNQVSHHRVELPLQPSRAVGSATVPPSQGAGSTKPTAAEQADTSISTPTHPGKRIRSDQTIPSQPIISTRPRQGKAVAASQPLSAQSQSKSIATRQSCWPYAAANHRHSDPFHPAALHKSIATRHSRRSSQGTNRSSSEPIEGESSDSTSTQQSPRTHSTRN